MPVRRQTGSKHYIYTDVQGKPLFRVVRRPGKRFIQQRWDADAEQYVNGLGDSIRVLYNLTGVFEQAVKGGTVWCVEGEADADALIDLGICATTNPGGAGKWRPEYAESLRGAGRVVICYDLDIPGQRHALQVEDSVKAVTNRIDFYHAAEGNDVRDHLAAGLGVGDLVKERPGNQNAPRQDAKITAGRPELSHDREPAVYQLAVARLHEYAAENDKTLPRKTDRGWEACCPAHDDNRPSLGVRVGAEQPLVVSCQAGCEAEAIADALKIDFKDFFGDGARPRLSNAGNLTLHTPAELARKPKPTTPLIRGVIAEGSYGPFGGKEKTLKSICADAGCIALASGMPMLGYAPWSVPEPKTVLKFAGEGGIDLAQRRLQRIANDLYGIGDISTIPLYVMEGTAELNGAYFREKTIEFVAEHGQPGLVDIDSLYNYHDADVEVTNLYARGQMLSEYQHFMQRECGPTCALWVIDHFRKTANSTDLDEYMQSGMAQWADSWWNAEHRREPDLDLNRFWLNVKIGSRHPYGGLYEIDIDEGPYDEEAMAWLQPMTAKVERVGSHAKNAGTQKMSDGEIDSEIMRLAESGQYTKTGIKHLIEAANDRVYGRVTKLLGEHQLKLVKEHRDGKRTDVVRPNVKVSIAGNPS